VPGARPPPCTRRRTPKTPPYILCESGSRFVFAEDKAQLTKLRERRDDLPDVEKVVLFDGEGDGNWVLSLEDVEALGKRHLQEHPNSVRERADAIPTEQLATLIYTSGTTGKPKGVRLPHRAWVYEGVAIASFGILDEADLQLLWLPLAHAFGKVLISAQLECAWARWDRSGQERRSSRRTDRLRTSRTPP
jgi:long-chain acyl-CoA synthetase